MKFTQALDALYRKKYPKKGGGKKGGTHKKQSSRKRRTYKTRSRV